MAATATGGDTPPVADGSGTSPPTRPAEVPAAGGHGAGRRHLPAVATAVLAVLVLVGTFALASGTGRRGDATPPGWEPVWEDDFSGTTLDAARWNVQDAASPRNAELQYYTPDNVEVRDGRLRLTARREDRHGRAYTSGAVDTFGKVSLTHGRVEVRARLPRMGPGLWPAVWMLGTGCHPTGPPCPWPAAGANEIDIAEVVNTPTTLHTDVHHADAPGRSLSTGPCSREVDDLSAGFSTFAVEWDPGGAVRWYLDDDLVCTREVPGHLDGPMYLILNTAVGGTWPGAPTDATPFPQRFDIDRVRVLRRS